jgi:hypothetical protein
MDNVIVVADESVEDTLTFTMSLTNCHVENSTYAVEVRPTTLRFPLRRDGAQLLEVGGFVSSMAGNVVFDFTAGEMQRRHHYQEKTTVVGVNSLSIQESLKVEQCITTNNEESRSKAKDQVQSILLKLDDETQFLKTALAMVGIFGLLLLTSIVWTGYKLTHSRKHRRRVRIVDSVPSDILRRQEDITPKESQVHETLHLISSRDGEKVTRETASPRWYYEDFLSPRGARIEEREEMARALFSTKDGRDGERSAVTDDGERLVERHSSSSLSQNQDEDLLLDVSGSRTARQEDADLLPLEGNQFLPKNFQDDSPIEVSKASQLPVEGTTIAPMCHEEAPKTNKMNSDLSALSKSDASKKNTTKPSQQKNNVAIIPTKSAFSPKSNTINILELAEHIETSFTPFRKRNSTPVLVSPEIESLSKMICHPAQTPPRSDNDFDEAVVDCSSSNDDKVVSFSKEDCFSLDPVQPIANEQSPPEGSKDPIPSLPLLEKAQENFDVISFADSMSSASLLVSLDSNGVRDTAEKMHLVDDTCCDLAVPEEVTSVPSVTPIDVRKTTNDDVESIADSMSSTSLLVSVDGDSDVISIQDADADDIQEQTTSQSDVVKCLEGSSDDSFSKLDDPNDAHTKQKEMMAHDMKHNVIQELKSSSRFKFKQTGTAASSFADELAVVTGNKPAIPENKDFASLLAKRVFEKENCKTPVKKSERRVLKPIDMSPPPESTNTDVSEFMSDYW